jgi:hypothetical protein
MDEENKLYYSLNDSEMQYLNPDALIISYTVLNKIFNIRELFENHDKIIILYLLENSHVGHWVCLFIGKNDIINFFNGYGENVDDELKDLSAFKRLQLDERRNRLTELLNNHIYEYNDIKLQGQRTQTCGMFVSHRLHNYKLSTIDYLNIFAKSKLKPDMLVANWCLEKLKNYYVS